MQDWLDRIKFFRRVGVIWAVMMITLVILTYVDSGMGKANAADGVIVTGIVGLFGLAFKFLLDRESK